MTPACHGLVLLLGFVVSCHPSRPLEQPTSPHIRVATYNVNWGVPEPMAAARVIAAADADIVCLQETNRRWERILRQQLRRQYPHMVFRESAGRAGGGLAFLSKRKGEQVAYIRSDTGFFDGWIMTFPTAVGRVQVLNVHLQPPVDDRGRFGLMGMLTAGARHRHEIERFHKHFDDEGHTLVVGDFNEDKGGDAITWLRRQGYRNCLPEFSPWAYTWRWRLGPLPLRGQLDHIVHSPSLHCFRARILYGGASDHLPVRATIGLRQ